MSYFLAIAIGSLTLGHLVAYKLFVSLFSDIASRNIWVVRLVFVFLFASFFLVMPLVRNHDTVFSNIAYTASVVWMGFLLYIFLAGVLYGIVWTVMHFVSPEMSVVWIGKALLVVAFLVGIYGLYNGQNTKVIERSVHIPNLPDSWKGRKAVFIADMHLGQVHGRGFSQRIAEKIKELNPDIIFDAGDLYDGIAGDAVNLVVPFSDLKPPLGYYFVTGNHEYYGDTLVYEDTIKEMGIHALYNEAVEVEGVRIAGADYATTRSKEELSGFLDGLKESDAPTILLKHVPLDLEVPEEKGISLHLSGHTHRAQLWPLGYITRAVYKGYDYGLKDFKSMKVLVTDGAGTWGPPMRVGTNSEIVLITFE